MSRRSKKVSSMIRNRYLNSEVTPEDLARIFNTDLLEVELILENLVDYDPDYEDGSYETRQDKCLTCGSEYDAWGRPLNCQGECEIPDEEYYVRPRGDGDPRELNFDE